MMVRFKKPADFLEELRLEHEQVEGGIVRVIMSSQAVKTKGYVVIASAVVRGQIMRLDWMVAAGDPSRGERLNHNESQAYDHLTEEIRKLFPHFQVRDGIFEETR